MLNQIRETIRKHRMLSATDRVLAGVSGGPDSVCLFHVLKELNVEFSVAHLNHALRGSESDDDETFVESLCRTHNVLFFARRAVIDPGRNVEDQGRRARREFFELLTRDEGFTKVALGHTRDDRAETFLLHLLRGAGTEGLVSMAPVAGFTVRPLIETSRDTVESYLRDRGLDWRVDASNVDARFARNRVRSVLIPLIQREFNPSFRETVSRTIDLLSGENAWMKARVEQWLGSHGKLLACGLGLPASGLALEPKAFVRRVIREALRRVSGSLESVSFDNIEQALHLLEAGRSGRWIEAPGGVCVERSFDTLIVRRLSAAIPDYDYELPIPGSVVVPEIGQTISAQIVPLGAAKSLQGAAFADAERLGPRVRIRNWKTGDYYRPAGLPSGKLKKLFQRARIPRCQRTGWPVIVSDSMIVWVASFPVSREFSPRSDCQKVVVFEALTL